MPTPCPHLPPPRDGLDWRTLNAFGPDNRGSAFYLACLEYGNAQWVRGYSGRAILCLDRAMGAEIGESDPVLATWQIPYAAMLWILTHADDPSLVGNPRVHFQHYADRMNEPRRELRRWRAWACWALARSSRPSLPGDPKHGVVEPGLDEIAGQLAALGLPGEAELWRSVLASAGGRPA